MTPEPSQPEHKWEEAVKRYMGPITSSLRPEADGCWVTYEEHRAIVWNLRHERNFWSWKYERRENECEELADRLRVAEARLSGFLDGLPRTIQLLQEASEQLDEDGNARLASECALEVEGSGGLHAILRTSSDPSPEPGEDDKAAALYPDLDLPKIRKRIAELSACSSDSEALSLVLGRSVQVVQNPNPRETE